MNNIKNKCSFCKYYSGTSCMVTPNSFYCKDANDEYYQYLQKRKGEVPKTTKSLRSWDKRK